ncbi:hypothetical protein EJB05_20423, partial [Eragrostis curvula]
MMFRVRACIASYSSEVTNWDMKMLILQISSLLALHFLLSPHGSDFRFRKAGIVYEACVGSVPLVASEKTEFDIAAS